MQRVVDALDVEAGAKGSARPVDNDRAHAFVLRQLNGR